mmetsp:Transcript_45107/g.127340  ORF Transcript_45107/g.127340 Transcript_45107/m.127340 type:complete len:104 (-) Transcript_45107:799-1110(-)
MMAQPGAASDCEEGVVKVVVGRDGKQQTFFSLKSDLVKYPFFSCLLDGEGHRREKEQQTVTLPESSGCCIPKLLARTIPPWLFTSKGWHREPGLTTLSRRLPL